DPTSATFTQTGSMAGGRSMPSSVLLGSGKVLVAGGVDSPPLTYLSTTELFDPTTKTFTPGPTMSTPRASHTIDVLPGGSVIVVGGTSGLNVGLASAEILALTAAGGACTVGDDCVSGSCDDGTCCIAACKLQCRTCNATGGCIAVA